MIATLLIWALVDVPLDKQAAIIRAMLQELKDLPFAKDERSSIRSSNTTRWRRRLQKDPTYLTDLERDSNAGLREAAAFLRIDMVRAEKQMAEFRKRASRPRRMPPNSAAPRPCASRSSSLRTMPRKH